MASDDNQANFVLCGPMLPFPVYSTGNFMSLTLVSATNDVPGFNASYETITDEMCKCLKILMIRIPIVIMVLFVIVIVKFVIMPIEYCHPCSFGNWIIKAQLKKCGVPTSDLITVYCSLIRSVIEYTSAVFANLPKYLSDALEGIQKRALRIILSNLHYDEALTLSDLSSLEDHRAAACESFMRNLKPSNPVYGLAMSRRITTVHSYSVRSWRNYNNKRCNTKRLLEFVSVKYLDFLS